VRRIATDRLREAFAELPDGQGSGQRRLADPVRANASGSGMEERRRKGDLLAEKFDEK
jgi:hypothetical protein